MAIVWVALGGACGATLRFLLVRLLSGGSLTSVTGNFPVGTLVANVSGSFLIGFLAACFFFDPKLAVGPKLFFQTGLLGAFTTFSAFSLETLQLWQAGQVKSAILNVGLNVGLCLVMVVLGMLLGASLAERIR